MAKTIRLPRITRELVQCQMCGYCIDVCEAHRQTPWESVTPRGKIYYLNQLDKAGFGLVDKIIGRKATISPDFVDAMYKCTGCGNCEEVCHAKIELVKLWEIVRAWLVQEGVAPLPVHKGIAKKIATTGNSFGEPASKRDAWWPADVERAEVPEAILYAGCTGSYRMQHIPAAGATILARAGVKINCLGSEEVCCSSPLLRVGIKDQTMGLAIKTVTKADGIGANDMIMTCSGCYKTISSNIGDYYSKAGQNVYHFTQYVDKLIKEKKLPMNNEFNARVTYHDPCHLGRHSKVYEEPRNVLKKIKGIDFVEMEKNRDHSRCCGAGGGYKSAFNDFAVNIAAERIKDAEDVGADVIATACPFCVLNLKAGAKKAGSKIKVMDISEILLQVTGPKVEAPKEEAKVEAAPAVDAEELAKIKTELEAAKAAADAAQKELADAKAVAEAAKAELEAAKAAADAAQKELADVKADAADAEAAKAEVEDLNSKFKQAEEILAEADAAIEQAEKDVEAAKADAAACKAKAEQFYKDVEALCAEADDVIAAKDKELADKDVAIAEKDKAIAAKDKELADKDVAIAEKDKAIADAKADADQFYKDVEALCAEADDVIAKIEADLAAAKAEAETAKAAAIAAEAAVAAAALEADEFYNEEEDLAIDFDSEEFQWDLTPEGVLRRAAWNKKLRCRRNYGELQIPVAFVKGKVAVYVDVDAPEAKAKLESQGWIVFSYNGLDITDGAKQAVEIRDAVKAQLRKMKKGKKKKK
ncbi:MAG: (Fe-S)-binding protein [Candidatus Methanomethylophilaceae archaeon]|nr:(Fe-S)-binding protein [Candidatus Methanomethylophilaceae archaeon]